MKISLMFCTLIVATSYQCHAQVNSRTVTFRYEPTKVHQKVSIAGDFNNWNKDASLMTLKSGVWTISLDLKFGKHPYKFVLDGQEWITDPKSETTEDDGNGNSNSIVQVSPIGFEKEAKRGDGDITLEAVSHSQEMPWVNWDNGTLFLTIQARTGDIQSAQVNVIGAGGKTYQMVEGIKGEHTTKWLARIPWDRSSAINYIFQLSDGSFGIGFDGYGVLLPTQKRATKTFTLDPGTYKPMVVPQWVEQSVIYQIFPDRFENGDTANDPENVQTWDGDPTWSNWFGGDIAGIQKKLGYLKSLGINCIYLNPIFEAPSNHRYETTDYKKIDHRLGTNQQFSELESRLRKAGIRTVLDGVFNHTATDFFAFRDVLKKQAKSEYVNWYSIKSFPVSVVDPPPYESWFGFRSMPKLNTARPEVQNYLLSIPEYWAKNSNIAGWRLDVANEVSQDYWKLFRKKVKSLSKDNWIVGEIWSDGSDWLKGDQFDSVMNYQFRTAVLEFVAQGKTKPSAFWNSLMTTYESYGAQVNRNLMNLLSSHDTPRILTECRNNGQLARLAAMIQFCWVGAPSVYYGDEIGMAGGADPGNRRGMEWPKATDSNPYLNLYKELIELRTMTPTLKSGEPELVSVDDETGVIVLKRKIGANWSLVAINRGQKLQKFFVKCNDSVRCLTFSNQKDSILCRKTVTKIKGGEVFSVEPLSVTVVSTDGPRQKKNEISSGENDTFIPSSRKAIHTYIEPMRS